MNYNVLLAQDVGELVGYLEQDLHSILPKFDPREYLSMRHVVEWMIREHIESYHNLACVEHYPKAHVYHRIRHRLKERLRPTLEQLLVSFILAPKLYNDNIFVQVDLKEPWDLYIQYYRVGRISENKF